MNQKNQNDEKKGLPNNFVYFLIAAVLAILLVQSFLETKFANVSFSYQLEHLVNLDLIQPDDSRKTAINDNLVSFSGKFREKKTDEGKVRFKFLTLLNENHQFVAKKEELTEEMTTYRQRIVDAGDFFLHLSGVTIPSGGYVIVEDVYNPLTQASDVVINQLSPKEVTNLPEVRKEFSRVKQSRTDAEVQHLSKAMSELIKQFRSPILGIGSEPMKQKLRALQSQVQDLSTKPVDEQLFASYDKILISLQDIVQKLNLRDDGYRLSELRSVRGYREAVESYQKNLEQLDDNQVQLDKARNDVADVIWYFNNQELSTKSLQKQDPEQFSHWYFNAKQEWDEFTKNRGGYFRAPDQPLNTVLEKTFRSEEPTPKYMGYLFPALIAFSVIALLYVLFARQVKGAGTNAMNFGKSPARLIMPQGDNKVTFKDVAGIDEAKEELEEIVEFLKSPQKFTSLGGRIPKGVLCIGPPGCGKTLIAKAVAGEANRPFFTISGSDFVEMFVGVGASRIRDLFEQAKKNAPCIIFMDEIDAVGRHRGAGIGGGHDEREQTLNQLLVEMDGFDTTEGVILMAATNRPDVLDKALLRPGRFDRRVVISLPDIKGRLEILKVHAKKIKLADDVDLSKLARATPGCSGADLENMLNEAALIAARKGKSAVEEIEINEARDKVLFGKERRSMEMDEGEKRSTAYHESGHAIVGLAVEHAEPIEKVTIIPRGMSLGATMFLPEKNRLSYWRKELIDQLAMLMGGRAAEETFLGDYSSGARQDIDQATQMARSMVCEYGMSDLGPVAYQERSESGQYLDMQTAHSKPYSEATAQLIDKEVADLLTTAHNRAIEIINKHREKVELMTQLLVEFETLDREDVKRIWAGSWDSEEKRIRIKKEEELKKKGLPVPPPPPGSEEKEGNRESQKPFTPPQEQEGTT